MRVYRSYVGRRVLVRCADVTYRGVLRSAWRGVLTLEAAVAIDRDSHQPVDGLVLIGTDRILHVQVPT